MKNTKNVFITGVALAIALFASVQVVAMEPGRRVNPNLAPVTKAHFERKIKLYTNEIKHLENEIKDPKQLQQKRNNIDYRDRMIGCLEELKDMYYGDEDYYPVDVDMLIDEWQV
jgi:hypothetical protein